MHFIIMSSVIFGLVHPMGKVILSTDLPLLDFCLLYIGLRLLFQIPFLKVSELRLKVPYTLLFVFGVVGAALQLSEFFGLAEGLPVHVVTFLVYSHPIWALILSYTINREKITRFEVARVFIGICGIYFIASRIINLSDLLNLKILAPIVAGFLIALWSSLSNKLRKTDLKPITISIFYDLFAFLAILFAIIITPSSGSHVTSIVNWLSFDSTHIWMIVFYSLAIGFLPNFLFYLGSGKTTNLNASLLLLIEPIVATAVAVFFFDEKITTDFLIGATLIIFSGIPSNYYRIRKVGFIGLLGFLVVIFHTENTFPKEIYLVELSPQDQNDYTVSSELKSIKVAGEIALMKAKKLFPKCHLELKSHLGIGSEQELTKYLDSFEFPKEPVGIVGLSRSTFARVGAKILNGKNISGISIGASAAKLNEINPLFYSIVSPLRSQMEAIHDESTKLNCAHTTGLFDNMDPLSSEYKVQFKKEFSKNGTSLDINPEKLDQSILKLTDKCIFIALNFSRSASIISKLIETRRTVLFGTGDWSIHSEELSALLTNKNGKKQSVRIATPTGWMSNINHNSKRFTSKIKNEYGMLSNPLGAYTYDAILLMSDLLCSSKPVESIITGGKSKPHLLREYLQISNEKNLISKMNIIYFGGNQ